MHKFYIPGLIALTGLIIGLAWAEQLTLTTYYPAPYGVYKEFTTTGRTLLATNPSGTDTQARVGIGTEEPLASLQISGWGHGIIHTISVPNRTYDILWYDYGDIVQPSPLPPHTNYRWDLTYRASDTTSTPNGTHELVLMKGTADGGTHMNVMTWWPDGRITGAWDNPISTPPSDVRLKKDIFTIPHALEKVLALRGVNFKWKDFEDQSLQMGMIAQEVEEVIPEVIYTADDEMQTKGIEYKYIVALLVEAVKEQQKEIEAIRDQLNNK